MIKMENNEIIEGAEILIYFENGEQISVNLNDLQLLTVIKALGLNNFDDEGYEAYSKSLLEKIIKGDINPFLPKVRDKK